MTARLEDRLAAAAARWSAHAVTGVLLGLPVVEAWIGVDRSWFRRRIVGGVDAGDPLVVSGVDARLVATLAGLEALTRHRTGAPGRVDVLAGHAEVAAAWAPAGDYGLLADAHGDAVLLLDRYRVEVAEVAAVLASRGVAGGDEIDRILDGGRS